MSAKFADFFLKNVHIKYFQIPVYGRFLAKKTIDFANIMCYDEFDHNREKLAEQIS